MFSRQPPARGILDPSTAHCGRLDRTARGLLVTVQLLTAEVSSRKAGHWRVCLALSDPLYAPDPLRRSLFWLRPRVLKDEGRVSELVAAPG